MSMGLLEEHDNILRAYQARKERAKEYRNRGEVENAKALEFYAEGIAYVYTQIFQRDIENATTIGSYEETAMNKSGIWKQN